jgi:hypothetical protein
LVVVPSCVSQPSFGLLQLAQPLRQVGTHTLFVQAVPPCALLHAVPQAPQFAVLFVMLISQPSE